MKLERFWREIEGSIKDLEDDIKADFALIQDVKNLDKNDLEMKKVLCKCFREGQVSGFNHVKREYKDLNCDLRELHDSLKWSVKHKELALKSAFALDNSDTQFIKMMEQGKKTSYEYVMMLLDEVES